MKPRTYILNAAGEPVPESDMIAWARWMGVVRRPVRRQSLGGGLVVSTIFLGIDHGFSLSPAPVLWETMLFDRDEATQFCHRCTGSREQAEAMHAQMVREIRAIKKGVGSTQ